MKERFEKVFKFKNIVWPPFLPIVAVILSVIFHNKWFFFVGATINIFFYTLFAFEIHNIDIEKNKLADNKFYIYNQYWLNGLGAFIGWFALYILLFYIIKINQCTPIIVIECWINNLGKKDIILIVITFLGLTGYIPYYALLIRQGIK